MHSWLSSGRQPPCSPTHQPVLVCSGCLASTTFTYTLAGNAGKCLLRESKFEDMLTSQSKQTRVDCADSPLPHANLSLRHACREAGSRLPAVKLKPSCISSCSAGVDEEVQRLCAVVMELRELPARLTQVKELPIYRNIPPPPAATNRHPPLSQVPLPPSTGNIGTCLHYPRVLPRTATAPAIAGTREGRSGRLAHRCAALAGARYRNINLNEALSGTSRKCDMKVLRRRHRRWRDTHRRPRRIIFFGACARFPSRGCASIPIKKLVAQLACRCPTLITPEPYSSASCLVCGGATRGGGDEFGHRKRVCRNENCALAQAAEGGVAVIDRDTNARVNLGMRGVYATCGVADIIPGYPPADQEEEDDTEEEESDEEDDDEEDGDEEDDVEEDGEEGGDGDEGGDGGRGGVDDGEGGGDEEGVDEEGDAIMA
ncbi:hypothetical protein JKP88DRAFT_243337 [Tribonema minus]|uniref:Uncharacterized protein n=1 Tax=Tribonema minus TaxID=303371 RepID=A0A835Z7F0_9STRA|nr:hypothetical protein JKP88DRAFT_243337 [Tribonema minus]